MCMREKEPLVIQSETDSLGWWALGVLAMVSVALMALGVAWTG